MNLFNEIKLMFENFQNFLKENINLIIIVILSIFLFIFAYLLWNNNASIESVNDVIKINLNSVYICFIMSLVPLIGIFVSIEVNKKTVSQTKKLYNQNIETRFIQLRFNNSKNAINILQEYIIFTLKIYTEIKKFMELNSDLKFVPLKPKYFLVMQLININFNDEIFFDIPSHLKNKLNIENFLKDFSFNSDVSSELEKIKKIKTANVLNISLIEQYKSFMNEYNNKHSHYKDLIFKTLCSSDISEEELYDLFFNIKEDLESKNIEDLLLEDLSY